jgi:hypothetical protein
MKNELTINGLQSSFAYCESIGLSNCFEAYANLGEDILELGFNPNSGYVYIALENGVSICSMLGQDVEYLVNDLDSGEDFFFDTMEEAENHFHTLNA